MGMIASKWHVTTLAVVVGMVLVACTPVPAAQPTPNPKSLPSADEVDGHPRQVQAPPQIDTPAPVDAPTPFRKTTPTPANAQDDDLERELRRAGISTRGWKTDFARHSVPFTEIESGGPPKDGIPAIDEPAFVTVAEADEWLDDREPVQTLEIGGDVRAYPLQILIWHEIVNDVVDGKSVSVTYCPLCNSAIVFDRTLPDGRVLDFGTTGKLRFSDLVMYDRQTESWWQQITGEAIVGELMGTRLEVIPSPIVSWAEFKAHSPDAKVLSRETGFPRAYGRNPYQGYDTAAPFLYTGPEDERLPALERVATVSIEDEAVAFPFSVLEKEPVVHYRLADRQLVVFYKKGTASALDDSAIAEGRDVGATGVFLPEIEGQKLTFSMADGEIKDKETGSTWSLLGEAIAGPLEGKRLEPVVHANHFWFSWAVFRPETLIYQGSDR
jgi:hypothetical protein